MTDQLHTTAQGKSLHLIQVLRGIAALLVVLLHATGNVELNLGQSFLGKAFVFGGAGVDIFFVLSGFIIMYTSLPHLSNKAYLGPFMRKRFVRIYPTYWIIITGFLAMQVLLPAYYNSVYPFGARNLAETYLLLPDHIMVNGVSWTLTNELFFYVLFALFFIVRNKKLLAWGLLVYSLLIIGWYAAGWENRLDSRWAKLIIFPMNIEFFLGVLSAVIFKRIPARYAPAMILMGSLLFITGAVLAAQGYYVFNNSFNRVLYSGIPAFILVLGVVRFETTRPSLRAPGFLLSLGDASYSLYLLHLPILAAACKLVAKAGVTNSFVVHALVLGIIFLVCVGSILFYKFLEKPIIRMFNSRKRLVART